MFKMLQRLMPRWLVVVFFSSSVFAQQPDRPPSLNLGDAVVSGFSGTLAPDPQQARPANKSVVDLTFINPDGPSARIINLGQPGYVWDGRLFQAPKTFDVFAKDVGQVFGIALDDATPPNIYLAATSAFGLQIVGRGRDGLPERRKKGAPGAGWMKGQFGLELQGGPGSIYKVDGRTGAVNLFANVTLEGVPNPGPGLGNLAYDAAHKQLFVSDLYSGMIHRFALDGRDIGAPYDHGVTARPTRANLPPLPFNPKNRPDIANARFDSENPGTWGFAPPARRVWALAVHEGRLYYSARNGAPTNGPQIWSVGIQQDGSFAADARWELDVADAPGPYAVSDITFSQKGAMILAQRAGVAGSYDYSAFTEPGQPRVLRYWLKDRIDPRSPGRWKPAEEEYAVGFAGSYRNSNGGVALGYGYDQNGTLSAAVCESALWATAQNLRNNPTLRSQLEPGGPLVVHGLQGSPVDMVRSANEPPWVSYPVDFDDTFEDPRATGHMGSVRILTQPCLAPVAVRGPFASPPGISTTPVGCVGPKCQPQACVPTCICPPGTVQQGRECVKSDICPPPMVTGAIPGQCVCPPGTVQLGQECVTQRLSVVCIPPMVFGPTPGSCICPPGTVQQGQQCVPPPNVCPPPLVPGPCVDETSIDLGVEKTGKTSPPVYVPWYAFQITVTNHGPGSANAGTITVTDIVPSGMTFTSVVPGLGWTCIPLSGGPSTLITCTYGLATNAGDVLPAINITAKANGNGPFPPFTNCAVVEFVPGSGYVDTNAGNNKSCVTVSKPGPLIVKKTVTSETEIPLPAGTLFPITVVCSPPSTTTSFNLTANGSYTVNDIPFGNTCTVSETLPPLPANLCPKGTVPVWLPAPSYSPSNSVVIDATTQTIMVHNSVRCEKKEVGVLSVTKYVSSDPRGIAGTLVFPVTAMCSNPTASYGMAVHNNTSSVPINVPVGSVCTFTETLPALPKDCNWLTPVYSPASVTIGSGLTQVVVTNSYTCREKPQACTPPQVLNVDGICACPPPMVTGAVPDQCFCPPGTVLRGNECVKQTTCQPPMIPGPVAGQCICPPGTVQKGRECVRQITCRSPMVPNAAGKECVCPTGTVQKGRECVKQTQTACKEPKKLNRRGACECPKDMVARGNGCVAKEKRERSSVTPNDVIRVVPYLIPGGRGNGGGSPGGGAAPSGGGYTPGKR